MSKTSLSVVLSDAEMIRLEQRIRAGSTPQQVVLRAQITKCGGADRQGVSASLGIGCGWEITGAATRKVGSAAEFSLFQSFDFTVF